MWRRERDKLMACELSWDVEEQGQQAGMWHEAAPQEKMGLVPSDID